MRYALIAMLIVFIVLCWGMQGRAEGETEGDSVITEFLAAYEGIPDSLMSELEEILNDSIPSIAKFVDLMRRIALDYRLRKLQEMMQTEDSLKARETYERLIKEERERQ